MKTKTVFVCKHGMRKRISKVDGKMHSLQLLEHIG